MFKEFKAFALRGNVIDLAVGIIIGAAFTGIVNSLVNDILMPPLGLILGGFDFSDYFLTLKGPHVETLAAAKTANAVTLNYGLFVNACVRFVIVAAAIFFLVRWMNRLFAAQEAKPSVPPKQEILLQEIRDVLKEKL